jgi:hypothetical protein
MKSMIMKQNRSPRLIGHLLAAAMLLTQAACAQEAASSAAKSAPQVHEQASPAEAARYQARVFELVDPDEARFDPVFSKKLVTLLAPQLKRQKNFLDRMLSGPATNGLYLVSGNRGYVYYAVCQAHHCDTTTMELLFDPATKRMVGKLLDQCSAQWLGQPDQEEQLLLQQRHQISYPATEKSCRN